jgi:hypothetical protein
MLYSSMLLYRQSYSERYVSIIALFQQNACGKIKEPGDRSQKKESLYYDYCNKIGFP